MDNFPDTFSINSTREASVFESFLHQYADSLDSSLRCTIPDLLISSLYTHCESNDGLRLFYAMLDLELSWMFMLKDGHLPAGLWNQELYRHRHAPKTVLGDYSTFCTRMRILESFNSMSLRLRACWDKYMGILILLHEPDKYEPYAKASSRKRTFVKIAREWNGIISPHIVRAITTTSRNGVVHAMKHLAKSLTSDQIAYANKSIDYFRDHDLDYPDPAVDIMAQQIDSVDHIRTSEAHGTGMLRKWSLASLSPDKSRDFSLYNYSNDFSHYMHGLHRSVLDVVGNDAGTNS